jgi:hypothetical protein
MTTLSSPCLDGQAWHAKKQGVTKEFPDAPSVTRFEAEGYTLDGDQG